MTRFTRKCMIVSLTLCLVFSVLTSLVMTFDLRTIGPEDSIIGLSYLNGFMRDLIGRNQGIELFSEILGVLCFLYPAYFGALGLYQLIKRKSFKKIDRDLYLTAGLYLVLGLLYLLFELITVNYRPILTDGVLEASYPSSHTLFAVTVTLSGSYQLYRRLQKTWQKYLSLFFGCFLGTLTVLLRLFSGVHWFTDILAGAILGLSLVFGYIALYSQNLRSDS